jgi:hypothetical protein
MALPSRARRRPKAPRVATRAGDPVVTRPKYEVEVSPDLDLEEFAEPEEKPKRARKKAAAKDPADE